MKERIRSALPALIALVLFVAGIEVLRRESHAITWPTLWADVLAIPASRLVLAALLTALNYAVLTGYDFLALSYVGRKLPALKVAAASFLSYAVANSVGVALLSGASVRYRFYSRWGIGRDELSRIVFSYSTTFWLGLLALGGLTLALGPLPAAHQIDAFALVRPMGWLLLAVSVGYVVAACVGRGPLRLRTFELPLPSPRLAMTQLALSSLDWALAGAVLFVLIPPHQVSFVTVLSAFLAAQFLGLASHLPGGVGVFEGLIVLLLGPVVDSPVLVPALVVYRVIYYLLPLAIALPALIADEVHQRRAHAVRLTSYVGRVTAQLTPQILATLTFVAGVVLLFSGATPAASGRLALLDRFLPLGIIETSHIVGSIAGALLLLLSQGLSRRLDAAYYLTVTALVAGVVASLLKGVDYEEALILSALLALLWRGRAMFDRKAALFATRFSPAWIASVVAALLGSIWLGLFAFKHVEYAHDLWWQFALGAEASRALRGSVAAATIVVLFAVARLMSHAPHEIDPPTDADLEDAGRAIEKQRSTFPYLVYLRDKALLFDDSREGFVMYGVHGRTWVALGDPVGPPERVPGLIRAFVEKCDDFGGTPVFYEVSKRYLHHYADFGLNVIKLGEEAKVDLQQFTLEGGTGAKYRHAITRLERDGAAFRMLTCEEVVAAADELRAVSDDWLKAKAAAEKGFSTGFFEPRYLARFPVAVVERGGRIQAFANLWQGPGKEELSIDLMRHHHDAPKGVMDALFAHVMKWGKEQGYRQFGLGMAPMSGFEPSPVATWWTRLGAFLYDHGEALYNFQGVRSYKDKFNPMWESRYLVYPGRLKLPRVLASVSALIAGGYLRIFGK